MWTRRWWREQMMFAREYCLQRAASYSQESTKYVGQTQTITTVHSLTDLTTLSTVHILCAQCSNISHSP